MSGFRMRRLARKNGGVKKWKGVVGYALPRPVLRWVQGVCEESEVNENVRRATVTLANLIGRCFTSPRSLSRDPDWQAHGAVFCLARDASNHRKGILGDGGILSHPMMVEAGITEHYFKLAKQILLKCGFIDLVSHPFTYNSNPRKNTTRRKPLTFRIGKRWFDVLHARPGLKTPARHPEKLNLQNTENSSNACKDSTPSPFGPVGLNSGDGLPSGRERTIPENPWICRIETPSERMRREGREAKTPRGLAAALRGALAAAGLAERPKPTTLTIRPTTWPQVIDRDGAILPAAQQWLGANVDQDACSIVLVDPGDDEKPCMAKITFGDPNMAVAFRMALGGTAP